MLHWFARLFPRLFSASILASSLLSPLSAPVVSAAGEDGTQVDSVAFNAAPAPPADSEAPFTLSIQPSAVAPALTAPTVEETVPAAAQTIQPVTDARGTATRAFQTNAGPATLRAPGAVITPKKQNVPALGLANPAPMTYHGGPVERVTSVNYTIFWRPATSFMTSTYQPLLNRYFQDIGGSPLYGLLTQYTDGGGAIVNSSSLGGTAVDSSAYPANPLSDADLRNAVIRAINANGWDYTNVNANFLVFTAFGEASCFSPNVCSTNVFCGYHSDFVVHNQSNQLFDLKYSNIPYGGNDPTGCGTPTSPNSDFDADTALNITSHEHFETATDPLGNGWYETNGAGEIGDKCAYNYGPMNGQGADVTINGHPYILQQEWSNQGLTCAMSLPAPNLTLSVAKAGLGSGTVTSNPVGISCGVTCSAGFPSGSTVVLTAVPAGGSVFAGWSGACSGVGTCSVTMDAAHSVTATFAGAPVCSPRPNVNISASPSSPGVLQVTVSASGTNVTLQSIQFSPAVNGLITGGGLVNSTGSVVVPMSGAPTAFVFTVRRATAGVASTVPFIVTDSCGTWSTFVGGGPSAF